MTASLSPRLSTVADMVLSGWPVADIGTDHGHLPVCLVTSGKCPRAVASDRMPGPLAAAARTVAAAGVQDRVELRLGDGLQVLAPGEVATAVLAGMGGPLMQKILAAAPDQLAALRRLVLQPNGGAPGLRRWLMGAGWALVSERLVEDTGRIYAVLAAEPVERPPEYTPADLLLGPLLRRARGPLFHRWVAEELDRTRRALAGARQARRPDPERLAELKERAAILSAAREGGADTE